MKAKKAAAVVAAFFVCSVVTGCSNILTYIRHDEGRNITCDGQKGIKRDSGCIVVPGN